MTDTVIKIDDQIKSTNGMLCRRCTCKLGDMKDKFEKALKAVGNLPKFTKKVSVGIYSYRVKEMDRDNAFVSIKALVDALRRTGVIEDDSPQYIEGPYFFQFLVGKARQRTEIIIKEIE